MLLVLMMVLVFILAGYMAFGSIKVDPQKLKAGVTPEAYLKKVRRMGYLFLVMGVFMTIFSVYTLWGMRL